MSVRADKKLRARMQRTLQPLRRATRWPVWADVLARLGVAFFLIAIVVMIHWFDREGLHDQVDGHISFADVVYFTMISVTTTGFGDIVPVSDKSRLIEAVIVTPIRIAILFIFVGTAYQFLLQRSWEKWRMSRIQAKLTNHLVVLGFGVSGHEAVRELIARGTKPETIVVMDPAQHRIRKAESLGCTVMEGDATRDENLVAMRIAQSESVLVSAGRDDSSILIVLTARHLAPNVPISVVIRSRDNELLARQAGATTVINPVSFTGLLLAGSAQGEHVADYLADLAGVGGLVQLRERVIGMDEVGNSLSNLASGGRGLRLYRQGQPYSFGDPEAESLQIGDTVVEVLNAAPPHAGKS